MLEETGTKVSTSTVKRVLNRHNLKGRTARKKPLLQNRHKKARQLHMGTKIILFGEKSSGLRKQKYNFLTIMTVCLEEKWGGLQAEEHHPNREARGWQRPVVGALCCEEGLVHFTK